MPYSRFFPRLFLSFHALRLSTRWSRAFGLFPRGFRWHHQTCCGPDVSVLDVSLFFNLPARCCANGLTLRNSSPVADVSSVDALCISLTPASTSPSYLAIDGSDWSFEVCLFFSFVFLDSGGEVDIWRIFVFQGCQSERLEINLWKKKYLLFSSITEWHWSHWSVLETRDWEKA